MMGRLQPQLCLSEELIYFLSGNLYPFCLNVSQEGKGFARLEITAGAAREIW
jgi:hypothetical protein